ncbi:hypothetical protein, partial [Maioricimonas sp. JC845]|uniref:hypothetical protein n=1 Tax=Maioricimonas sp. JC845 TaxID=3232138 RepID=UPI0034588D14
TMSCEYAEYPPGVWFPSRVEHQRTSAEGELDRHEIATVESADFAYRPDEVRFSLLSLDLPVGKNVNDNGIWKAWNGRELETRGQQRVRQVQEVKQEQQSGFWWPYAAAGLAVMAVVLVVWHRRTAVGILALLMLCGSVHAAEVTPGMELELKLLEYRQQLDHGKVVFKVETLKTKPHQVGPGHNGRYEIEFDGKQIRSEFQTEDYPIGPDRQILTSDQIIVMNHDFSSILDLDKRVSSGSLDVLNPTLLGAAQGPVVMLDNWTLEERLAYPDRSNET